jgi:cobalt/nickel transport system permease protein
MQHHAESNARDTKLSSFDPRVKLVCTFALVVLVSTFTDLRALGISLVFTVALIALSRVPATLVIRGYALALPFIIFASITMLLTSGAGTAMAMGLRVSTSVLLLLLLVNTTPFMDLVWTLRWFRMPSLLSDMIMFTYRFIFVMLDEVERMRLARKSRGFKGGRSLLDKEAFKVLSNTIGMIFLRSYRRADRVYLALLSRGYEGRVRPLGGYRVRPRDAAMGLVFIIIGALALSQQMGWYAWW